MLGDSTFLAALAFLDAVHADPGGPREAWPINQNDRLVQPVDGWLTEIHFGQIHAAASTLAHRVIGTNSRVRSESFLPLLWLPNGLAPGYYFDEKWGGLMKWSFPELMVQKACIVAFALVIGVSAPARAGPMEDADAAWRQGDYATAARLYRSLAEQGKASAQHSLAKMYENGEGVPRSSAEALKWYRLAAEQGHAGAQYYLGGVYATGAGVPRDYVQAYVWFSLSLSGGQGEVAAQGVRDMEEKISPAQIAEAERRVREWKQKKNR